MLSNKVFITLIMQRIWIYATKTIYKYIKVKSIGFLEGFMDKVN